jgi:hypothetical protein
MGLSRRRRRGGRGKPPPHSPPRRSRDRVSQLGIWRAIRELLGVNPHVKIFVSIRKEAFNSLDHYDRNAVNISSLAVQLRRTRSRHSMR